MVLSMPTVNSSYKSYIRVSASRDLTQKRNQTYQCIYELLELQRHVFRVGSLQHQQHLLVQRLIQRGGEAHSGGQMVNCMGSLQRYLHKPKGN